MSIVDLIYQGLPVVTHDAALQEKFSEASEVVLSEVETPS